MSLSLRRAVRGGVFGFALGLLLSLLFSVSAEVALLRACAAFLVVASSTFLASSLNTEVQIADEEEVLHP